MIKDLDDLKARVDAVLAEEIPSDSADPVAFFYHSREWCEGYRQAFEDLSRELE